MRILNLKPDTMILKRNLDLFNASRATLLLAPVTDSDLVTHGPELFAETREAALAYLLDRRGQLPSTPFTEFHPYKESYPLRSEFSVYLMGTFPPISYLLDLLPLAKLPQLVKPGGGSIKKPKVSFYHGQRCAQWKLFDPQLIPKTITPANRAAVRAALIAFLQDAGVNYVDVIDGCQRLDYDAKDSHLFNILPNLAAFEALLACPHENPLLIFNTSSAFGTGGLNFMADGSFQPQAKSFDIFLAVVLEMQCPVAFSVDGAAWLAVTPRNAAAIKRQMSSKLVFYMMLDKKVFNVVAGVSPSGATLNLGANPCFQQYCHSAGTTDQQSFKRFVYRNAIQKNLGPLWNLNV
ncbi:hypothetical protein [Flaviaesturariibacter amylovorans]|uniref:Uncharacterized protein n=1 Tax=Flaviaesturariibacter amylovorans TaxID=1084520 RepID=A0ABP8G766_9BACT